MSWFDVLTNGGFSGGMSFPGGGNMQQPSQVSGTIQDLIDKLRRQQSSQRKVDRLGAISDQFGQLAQTPGNGNYQPRQMGGLFPTVQQWSPDYKQMGNELVGSIGKFMADRAKSGEQGAVDDQRAEGVLNAAGALGGDGGKNDAALRAYLGMAGGPGMANMSNTPRVQSTQTDSDGNMWTVMSNGQWIPSGKTANYNTRQVTDAEGNVYSVGTSGAGRGEATPIWKQAADSTQYVNPGPQAPEMSRDDLHQRQMQQESRGNQGAVSPKGARGLMQLMPATARSLEQQLGLPPGSTDTDAGANEKAGRAYMDQLLEKNKGDKVRALVEYNWGMGNARGWDGNPATLPAETRDYVTKILGPGAFGGGQGPAQPSRVPLRQQTSAEKAGAEATAKAQAAAANVDALATVKGAETLASERAKNQAAAQDGLGKVRQVSNRVIAAIDELSNDPGLTQILGKSVYGRMDDKMADRAVPLFSAGSPAANAYYKYSNLQGSNFLQAFESLKGGGQITEKEGEQAKAAFARLQRSQSEPEFRRALADLRKFAEDALTNAERKAAGGSAPAAPAKALPAGWSVKVK